MFMEDENEKAAEDIFPLTEKRAVIECESLYTEIRRLRHDLAVEQRWHRAFMRLVDDMHDDFKCEPTCNKYGHSELCAATDPVAAFRKLRERVELAEKRLVEAVVIVVELTAFVCRLRGGDRPAPSEVLTHWNRARAFLATLEKKP